jgi:hypothetical protein
VRIAQPDLWHTPRTPSKACHHLASQVFTLPGSNALAGVPVVSVIGLDLTAAEFASGRQFGSVGAYEDLRGRASFALDPGHPFNQAITDVGLAPRGADGCVVFSADVRILRPVHASRSNRVLLLDVVNRGNPIVVRSTEPEPVARGALEDASSGWPMQHGYTLVCCGWQHDVPAGSGRLGLTAPEAMHDGRPLSGKIAVYQQFDAPTQIFPLAYGDHVGYPVLDPAEEAATLTERDYPQGPARVIPRHSWSFDRLEGGEPSVDRAHVYFKEGFAKGKIYEVVYTTQGAPLTGLGLVATRDLLSFLRFASAESGNPCAQQLNHVLAFGASQTGRFLRQMVYRGFCGDEQGRLVIDGMLALIGGPIRGEANLRFGQPAISSTNSPGFQFPFTDIVQTDPVTGLTDGLQHVIQERGLAPKLMYINSSAEYTNQNAALIHTSADGTGDVPVPDNVRIYHFVGTQHGGGALPLTNAMFGGQTAYYNNSVDYRPLLRAALTNLTAWVVQGVDPPPSRYPRLSDGTLTDGDTFRQRMARLPGVGFPAHKLYPTVRLDYGARLSSHGQFEKLPPEAGAAYRELMPAVDDDGNIVAGVRHPDVAVPLATYTGWNPRHADVGGEDMNVLLNGATIPFTRTAAERAALGDPRPSIQERWSSSEAYLAELRGAAEKLAVDGYLLEEDIERIVGTGRLKYAQFMQLSSPLPSMGSASM